jgi:hypothetical protein
VTRELSSAEICAQLEVVGGDLTKQAAAKAVVAAALAESLKLGPVAIRNGGDRALPKWNSTQMRKSPRGSASA